ncbi:MAG: alanine--glyoxylate aminotransferase family protein [Candidatus Omnitrophica bacterium]|nr:alanine--glyoxylate aminotransferase family protein [Candidatus Omnitrophota bacterium]
MTTKRQLLLTPGPTNVPDAVLEAMKIPMIHHRTKDYQAIFERVNQSLKKVFLTQHPVVTFAASGTGAMEASMTNLLSAGDKVIVAHAGKFGERWRDLAKAYGVEAVCLEKPYGKALDPAEIARALKQHPDAKAVYVTLLETSTAVVHPIREIAAITRESQAILVVDAISGLACDPLKMDEWGVDVVVCGSQKGLMMPPGLAFIAAGPRAQQLIGESKLPKFYFHLGAALKALAKNDTPYTPAVSLVRALEVALDLILKEGPEAVWARHQKIAEWVREKARGAGLQIFSESPSNGLTAILMPEKVVSDQVIRTMRDKHGVIMANGQGDLKGRIVRFAHMGDTARPESAETGWCALTDALEVCSQATPAGGK